MCRRSPRSTRRVAASRSWRAPSRCFARHGYEGATVARLEAETGLSRGAIFNYFPNKDAIFLAIATGLVRPPDGDLARAGLRALLDALVEEDPDWLSVQLEAIRRLRTDPDFQRAVAEHDEAGAPARRERLRGSPSKACATTSRSNRSARSSSTVANGLALRLTVGDPPRPRRHRRTGGARGSRPSERKQRGEWKQTTPVPVVRSHRRDVRRRPDRRGDPGARARARAPELDALDLVTLSAATFKASRTISHDRVASFLREPFVEGAAYDGDEIPAGEGMQRASASSSLHALRRHGSPPVSVRRRSSRRASGES